MGDEDHSDAPLRHAPDGIQQRVGLLLGEHGGGLVQDQQLQLLLGQLAGNLGKLLVPHGHVVDGHGALDVNAHLLDGLLRLALHVLAVQRVKPVAEHLGGEALLLGLAVEQYVLVGGEAGDQ